MEFAGTSNANGGFTRADVLALALAAMALLLVAGMLLLPMLAGHGTPSRRARCLSNLKELSLSEKIWNLDHCHRFPWHISTNAGGTLEYADSSDVYRHFVPISGELSSPKILVCPSDKGRAPVKNLAKKMGNRNISYFVGLDADTQHPQTLLHGDRNIAGGIAARVGWTFNQTNSPSWDTNIHGSVGNIALADGSTFALTSAELASIFKEAMTNAGTPSLRLAVPQSAE